MTDTLDFYKSRGLAQRVGFGARPALLIVDFIKGFTDLASPLASNLDKEIAATKKALNAARKLKLPIAFTTVEYDAGFRDAGVFIKKVPSLAVLKKGSTWVEVDDRLKPRANEHVLVKKYASAFFGTALASTLTAAGVDTLLLAGCTTSGCVRASAVDGCQHGFRTIVIEECVGDRAQGPHLANLFDINAKYGDVITLAETLAYLKTVAA
ncbi:MAG: isochorismatase family protein [Acidobacteria bacterium]|nr:isochorismatase family protein [Acidobacteriota bacterium]MBI3427420.1 isochorismatase family protein [Acidobacteriota bacterium]